MKEIDEKPVKVLLFEDNPGDARLLREMLAEARNASFDLEYADRLSTGLKRLAEGGIDAILLDLSLPDSQGHDTFARAHAQAPQVPIIVLTGLDDEVLAARAVREGAQDYLVKGQVDSNLLERSMRYAIERKRAEEEIRWRAEMLAALHETALDLAAQRALPDLLQAIVARAVNLLRAKAGAIYLYRPATDDLELVLNHRMEKDFIGVVLQRGEGLSGKVLETGQPLALADYSRWEGRAVQYEEAHFTAVIAVPIFWGDRLLGVLNVVDETPRTFSPADVALLERFTPLAAAALEQTRLLEGLEAEVAARTVEIQAEQEKSEAILRSAGDPIVMFDLEGQIQYVNDAFTALTGYTAGEALGQQMSSLMGEGMSEQTQQSLRLALAQGRVWQGEVTHRRKDGRTYEAALTAAPMRDAEGRLVGSVSSHRDISRRKKLDRARSRFMTHVSHELRTPVANMKLYAQLLQMGRRPEKTERYLQVLVEQADRLVALIQDMLEMTELDSGQAVTVWKPVSLPSVITNAVICYQSQAEAAGLTLVALPVPPDLPAVKGDQSRLTQALGELVENAVIFTPAGGQVTVEAGTAEAEGQPWVTVAVHDTGPGISPEEQERVFDRFYRGNLAESGHVPGTGLGLSIVQEIMRAHGGRVTVESPSTPLRTGPSTPPFDSAQDELRTGPSTPPFDSAQDELRTGPSTPPFDSAQDELRTGEAGRGSTFTLWLRPELSAWAFGSLREGPRREIRALASAQ